MEVMNPPANNVVIPAGALDTENNAIIPTESPDVENNGPPNIEKDVDEIDCTDYEPRVDITKYYVRLYLFVATFAGFLGWLIQLCLLNKGGMYGWSLPLVTGVWLSGLICFYAGSTFLGTYHHDFFAREGGCCSSSFTSFWRYYYYCVAIFAGLLVIGYSVWRLDAPFWAFALFGLSCFCAWVENHFNSCRRGHVDLCEQIPCGPANPSPMYLRWIKISIITLNVFRILAFCFTGLLLGGAFMQANGYHIYKPDGTFVTIKTSTGVKQRILTQCVGIASSGIPTIWVEVGGGGHSMSDLWGLRDYLVNNYHVRWCSYDMPGCGYSDPGIIPDQLEHPITSTVMDAMGETGPFICLGSMDAGDERCLKYCVANPTKCKAIVPVSFAGPDEFSNYYNYYGAKATPGGDAVSMSRIVNNQRMHLGNLFNFFGVSWGIIAAVVTNEEYVPKNRAYESIFLNLLNEKQWAWQSSALYYAVLDPVRYWNVGKMNPWVDPAIGGALPQSIPVLGFTLNMSTADLNAQCVDWGYKVGSNDCGYLFNTYSATLSAQRSVIAKNNQSKLFACSASSDCKGANRNSFVVNQGAQIPWFSKTLMTALKQLGYQ